MSRKQLIDAGFNNLAPNGFELTWWRGTGKDSDKIGIFPIEGTKKFKDEVCYAFVADEQVMYVGYSDRGAHRRFTGYINPDKQRPSSTDFKMKTRIINIIESGFVVKIYLWHEKEELFIGDFKVNRCASLEKALIRKLNPIWNKRS